ncbi:four-carbon acid sugar kinase family protein [Desulfopila sp. IMCC35008]|uniref:four-carbon acid sugar kinase family protein n=1 Tax=Desulfopila sp. IMCC35008 TaxID=2653858 RepID=UPI0013D39CB0|nr:four-carbon acid sugar kinase family protein [Desulfopila sp. IMCC35008]
MTRIPDYIFCGDDFTGASDTLATLARGGLNCRLFLDAQTLLNCQDLSELDAAGIATATRSMPPADIINTLQPVGKILEQQSKSVFHYKVCSTFDSSPETGSIGTAVNTLKQIKPESNIFISGGQPSLGRYCVFNNLFAAAADGAVYRIDRHPTMANHPVTPMQESDLVRLLNSQGLPNISGIHRSLYSSLSHDIARQTNTLWNKGVAVLFDVEEDTDIKILGSVLASNRDTVTLAVGSSSIAEAYLSQRESGDTPTTTRTPSLPKKPVFIIAGSRSPVTATQVQNSRGFHKLLIDPEQIGRDRVTALDKYLSECTECLKNSSHVLAIVTSNMNHHLSRADIAGFTAALTARVAFSGLVDRIGIAGGDTSSLALQELGADSLSYEADIEPGLCLCRLHSAKQQKINGLEIILKGGQMGSPELFNKLTGPL